MRNFTANLTWAYEPPITLVQGSLEVGESWCDLIQVYDDLEGEPPAGDPFVFCLRVYESGDVVVPAGTFFAFGIGQSLPRLTIASGQHDLLGRSTRVSSAGGSATDWYAEGVGEVLFRVGGRFELLDWKIGATPSVETSWSRVKVLYR